MDIDDIIYEELNSIRPKSHAELLIEKTEKKFFNEKRDVTEALPSTLKEDREKLIEKLKLLKRKLSNCKNVRNAKAKVNDDIAKKRKSLRDEIKIIENQILILEQDEEDPVDAIQKIAKDQQKRHEAELDNFRPTFSDLIN